MELSDKYTKTEGSIWIGGVQAIVRLLLEQSQLDTKKGIKTAGFVSGYRGSPLGGVDQALSREANRLRKANVHFEPGVNEDLAATAVWGTQQTNLYAGAQYEGVFGLWYGKSPGLDRSGDVFRHANNAGTSPYGGVVAIVGDDPACKSSTLPSASAGPLREFQVPVLVPSDVEDLIRLGLAGWAMSRYSGCWSALTAVTAVMDSAASVPLDDINRAFLEPRHDFEPHIRLLDTPREQETRMIQKLELAVKFASVNGLNQIVVDAANPQTTLVGTGKAYSDLRQALLDLGYDNDRKLSEAGVRLVKMGMVWPLDGSDVRELVRDSKRVLVIEGKGNLLEETLKTKLYGPDAPDIRGKSDDLESYLIATTGEPNSDDILQLLVRYFSEIGVALPVPVDLGLRYATPKIEAPPSANESRKPLFCPGCPHSVSTVIPEGSRALAGIGCHYMVQWMDRNTYTFTHMGGEGVNWIGQAPFTTEEHIFVNLGDGTYFHSGLMAIRAAVAAGVNITYKILYNDAVAMTGGQEVEGNLSVDDVVRQVRAENVAAIHLVTDEPERYEEKRYSVSHRDDLLDVQERLREIPGCTVLIYDQVCANELRRRRKRGQTPRKLKRVVINDAVCEGCGDCTRASMCSAIEPVSTDFGIKRRINQTACNQDLSCLKGYCPAMLEIEADLHEPERVPVDIGDLPEPRLSLPEGANILVAGVGGTGIVTLSQVLGTAAHLEGKYASTLDMTGLAQKGGAVFAHVRIDSKPVLRIQMSMRSADVLLASDPVTSASKESIALLSNESTSCVANTHLVPTSKFVLYRERDLHRTDLIDDLAACTKTLETVDADRLAARVCGASTTANMVLLGYAWQRGLVPLRADSIERTLELNGTLVADNILAFRAGRKYAVDSSFMGFADRPDEAMFPIKTRTLDELVKDRMQHLTEYQNSRYAAQLQSFSDEIQKAEQRVGSTKFALTELATETYFRFLATKDEYEVARLLTHKRFQSFLNQRFDKIRRQSFALAPSWLPGTEKSKVRFGRWFFVVLKILSKFKGLRATPIDPFRYSSERKFERMLRSKFEADMKLVREKLNISNLNTALELVQCYSEVRGFGHVKEESWERVQSRVEELMSSIQESQIPSTREESLTVA
ncbi:MAG: indolepyruvate ferredoxin oxidoreductase family protein [Gammaproteobacteria bacterium]|nr:indolepyruvate ferredoxin oxidoreductase family protein [Gammaproteobacteria bacterium]